MTSFLHVSYSSSKLLAWLRYTVNKKAAFTTMATVCYNYLTICLIHPLIHPPVPTMLIKKLMSQRQLKWYQSRHSLYLEWMNPNLDPNPFPRRTTQNSPCYRYNLVISAAASRVKRVCYVVDFHHKLITTQLKVRWETTTNLSVDLRDHKRYCNSLT